MSTWFERMFPGCAMEIKITEAGNYLLFAPPGMTIEDVVQTLPANHPVNGGAPSKGTKKDGRLTRNKPKPPVKKG